METKICKICGMNKDIIEYYKGYAKCICCYNKLRKKDINNLLHDNYVESKNIIYKKCKNCYEEKDIFDFNKGHAICKKCFNYKRRVIKEITDITINNIIPPIKENNCE